MSPRLHPGLRTASLLLAVPAVLALADRAQGQTAEGPRPVIVEFRAPPACGSSDAFEKLLGAEIARSPNPARPWRFSVKVVQQAGSYEGTLTTETGVRHVAASRCDDVTAALAVIIAMAEPEAPAAPETPVAPAASPPPPPPALALPVVGTGTALQPADAPPSAVERPGSPAAPSQLEWRLAAKGILSNHGGNGLYEMGGGMGTLSVELPWGLQKMVFEIGAGSMVNTTGPGGSLAPLGLPSATSQRYDFVDTQACLLDLPIARTGMSFLGCLRLAGAVFHTTFGSAGTSSGGAFWPGGGLRLRWQSPVRVFVEVEADAVYGTVSGGESITAGWGDLSATAGVRL